MNTTLRLALLLLLGLPSAAQTAQPAAKPAPLTIADQGYFFVAGQYAAAKDGQIMTGQMSTCSIKFRNSASTATRSSCGMAAVRPAPISSARPTDAWAGPSYFVRQGYAVYVVDQPGRARSGYFTDTYGPTRRPNATAMSERFTAPRAGEALSASGAAYPMAGQRRRRRSDV